MKKKLALILVLVMAFVSVGQSVGAINVIMNSSFVEFPDQEPVIENGTTLVPIRPIAEKLGLEISWDDPTDTVTLKKGDFYIELVIGSTVAKTSSGEKTLLTAPKIINGRTMVPLRFIAEALGLNVTWNNEYQRVIITGEIDTTVAPIAPAEGETVPSGEDATIVPDEKPSETTDEVATEIIDEADDLVYSIVDTGNSTVTVEIPVDFYYDDFENTDSFAYRALDAFDIQYYLAYESVEFKDCYADESGNSGIVVLLKNLGSYLGEEYDISNMNEEYPEIPEIPMFNEQPPTPPEDPEILYDEEFFIQYVMAVMKKVCDDRGVELPEDILEYETEEILALLSIETEEELAELLITASETADYSHIEGYEEYKRYMEEYDAYMEEYEAYYEAYEAWYETEYIRWMQTDYLEWSTEKSRIASIRRYALRHYQSLYQSQSPEEWMKLLDNYFNTNEFVRYEGIEIIDFDGKKLIHATVYAEEEYDEQGSFELCLYIEGDYCVIVIGGTLNGAEPGEDITNALARIKVK